MDKERLNLPRSSCDEDTESMASGEGRPPPGVGPYTWRLQRLGERFAALEATVAGAVKELEDQKDYEERLRKVEVQIALFSSRGDVWGKVIYFGWSLLLALIAAGVWFDK